MSEKSWHYLEVSSGRLFCSQHGGFCDVSDDYSTACPICTSLDGVTVDGNEISSNLTQRSLRVINGLQDRSKRNAALVGSAFGGLSLLNLISAATERGLLADVERNFWLNFLTVFPLILLVLSFISFAMSMSQVPVTQGKKIPSKTKIEWEQFFAQKLASMEWYHKWGGRFTVIAGLSIVALILCVLFLLHYPS